MAAKTRRKTAKSTSHARQARRKAAGRAKRSGTRQTAAKTRLWSHRVTQESDALDLKEGVFALDNPKRIAASLKHSAERSRRRKANPFRSALSMLTFYINRAGRNLPARRRQILNKAKEELRRQFHRA